MKQSRMFAAVAALAAGLAGCQGADEPNADASPREDAPYEPDPRRWRVLAVSLVVGFMSLLDVTIVNVAVPSIRAGLDTSAATIQWVVSGYALAFGMTLVAGGRLGDAHGRRRMMTIGLIGLAGVGGSIAFLLSLDGGQRFLGLDTHHPEPQPAERLPDDLLGKTGLESQYETDLRGIYGAFGSCPPAGNGQGGFNGTSAAATSPCGMQPRSRRGCG